MKKIVMVILMVLFPVVCLGLSIRVNFDTPDDPTDRTVVLVSDVSGDFSASYGQLSEPGVSSVVIDNIINQKEYFYIAYRWKTDGRTSDNSQEVAYTADKPADLPVVYSLPPIELPNVVLNITVQVE